MITVYKYPIKITDKQVITVPATAMPLHVGLDPQGVPCIWAKVNTNTAAAKQAIFVVGTGNPMPEGADYYLGSFLQGPFVWHVFCSIAAVH